ncbi:MAG TPA: energy-coupling factor transporter transmembrane component T [Dissulfurispiraceae bacterium]
MENKIPPFLLHDKSHEAQPLRAEPKAREGAAKLSFIDKGLKYAARVVHTGYIQWETASGKGLLQGTDARVKALFFIFFIVIVSLKRELSAEAAISAFILVLAVLSRLRLFAFYRKVLLAGLVFGLAVALPSSLNSISGGRVLFPILTLPRAYDFWIYHIPREIGITREGLLGVALLTLRVVNSFSLSLLMISTTPFPELVRALKAFRVPDAVLIMLTLAYKYIFIFARTIEELHLAKRSRIAGEVSGAEGREWIAGRIVFIFRKTRIKCDEVFNAMLGRGFSGVVRLHGFRKPSASDWGLGIIFAFAGFWFILI